MPKGDRSTLSQNCWAGTEMLKRGKIGIVSFCKEQSVTLVRNLISLPLLGTATFIRNLVEGQVLHGSACPGPFRGWL